MSSAEEPIAGDHGMTIYIDGSEFQPLKKIAGRDQLLELAKLDAQDIEIFLIDKDGKKMAIENDDGVQLQDGMRFQTQHWAGS